MIPNMPTLGIRFDINRGGQGFYGQECWEVFWRCTEPLQLKSVLFFHGDTSATLADKENVYCIAVQSLDKSILEEIRNSLSQCEEFNKVCADPVFIEGPSCTAEPLPEAGKINNLGRLEDGAAFVLRDALEIVDKEKYRRKRVDVHPPAARKPAPKKWGFMKTVLIAIFIFICLAGATCILSLLNR